MSHFPETENFNRGPVVMDHVEMGRTALERILADGTAAQQRRVVAYLEFERDLIEWFRDQENLQRQQQPPQQRPAP
jgi:hypothetical protein